MILEKLKGIQNKKTIENLVIFLVLAIILIVVINTLFSADGDKEESAKDIIKIIDNKEGNSDELESKLEKILSMIDGVRKCKSNDNIHSGNRKNTNV